MPRKSLLIGVPVLIVAVTAVALVAVAVVLPRLQHAAPIEAKAIGLWRETGQAHPARMEIRRDLVSTGRIWYLVRYPASSKSTDSASLDGDRIVVWGENSMSAPLWYLTYDAGTDVLTAVQAYGHETHTLRRVSP